MKQHLLEGILAMDRTLETEVTGQLLTLLERPSMSLGDEMAELPASDYTDPERWARERVRLFGDLPLLAALSGELPAPGDWKLFEPAGRSILLVRGDDGEVRGFLNACRHRGAMVVEQLRGSSGRFACPYHSWVYDTQGALVGVPHPQTFAGMCKEDRGLRPVSVREEAGAVWVVPRSNGEPFDLAAHLGPFAAELERWNLANLHWFEQREHRVHANWKLSMDTFTEAYHIPNLHKNSIGAFAAGGLNVSTQFGTHHRQVVAMKHLKDFRAVPRDEWDPFDAGALGFVYLIFPNAVLLFFGDHAEMFQVFPADDVDRSITMQTMFDYTPIDTDDRKSVLRGTFDFFYDLVATEDYRMAANVQRMLTAGVEDTFLLGRCETVTQAMHREYRRIVGRG